MLHAIGEEARQRAHELAGERVETIYFGGGTPSLLSAQEIRQLCELLQAHYDLSDTMEITLEANPDDLQSLDYLRALRQETPVNRLSIGLQSFVEADLHYMNRAHNAQEAALCLENAETMGFDNLSVDLIYGTPTLSDAAWRENLRRVFAHKIQHLSCYALTVEPKTALAHRVKTKKAASPEEEQAARQFEILLADTAAAGFEHYEISNFCRPPHYARHNTAYWQGKKYVGLGAAAHSYDGQRRRWNVANNALYIRSVLDGAPFWEEEILTKRDIFNETLMTALRTRWGLTSERLGRFSEQERAHFEQGAAAFLQRGLLLQEGAGYRLSDAGKLLADSILAELFM